MNQKPNTEVSLEPICRMIKAAKLDAAGAAQILGGLFEETGRDLFPGVGDPLGANLEFGSHRWLAGDREESYSDWLAWILERQDDPARVLPLFGLDAQPVPDRPWSVEREVVTPFGRLDLVIRDPHLGVLCVEVKTESDPGEDQLERYSDWLAGRSPRLGLVLLARDRPDGKTLPKECRFCSWEHIALSLRMWASDWLHTESTTRRMFDAAMTLAFCGAVERNLLSLGGGGLNALRTADYLEEVLRNGQAQTTIR